MKGPGDLYTGPDFDCICDEDPCVCDERREEERTEWLIGQAEQERD